MESLNKESKMSRMSDYQIEICETKREELIEDEIKELMKEGAEYHPFSLHNFTEAMQNMTDASYMTLAAFAGTANDLPKNDFAQNSCAYTLLKFVKSYWENVAREEAEESVSSIEELHEDYHAEQLDARMDAAKDKRIGL